MDGDAQLDFLRIMDSMRDRVPPSEVPARALAVALERGLHLGLDDIREWSRWMDTKAGLFICPTMIVEYIEQLTAGLHPHVVADPWAGIGSLLIPIAEKLAPVLGIGIERSPEALKISAPSGRRGRGRLGRVRSDLRPRDTKWGVRPDRLLPTDDPTHGVPFLRVP